MKTLDEKMADAGMIPLSELLAGTSIDKYRVHQGIKTVEDFLELAERKHSEYTEMHIRHELSSERDILSYLDNEMFEWVLAHRAVWGEVVFNLRAVLAEETGEENG